MTISSTPDIPEYTGVNVINGVRIASPDILIQGADIENAGIQILLFESIGGMELINIARHDTVNGQEVIYSPIKNLSELAIQYSPQNIISLQNPSTSYFNNFPIDLQDKIPEVGNGQNGEVVYLDKVTGDIIINVINVNENEQVEVQILTAGELVDDTIYTEVLI